MVLSLHRRLLRLDLAPVDRQKHLGGDEKREEQLVLLKQRAAHHLVEKVGEVPGDVPQAGLQLRGPVRVVDAAQEELGVPLQRVLVHVADVGHVGYAEEQDGGMLRHRPVSRSRQIDLHLGLVGDLLLLRDFIGQHLGRAEHLNRFFVLQNVTLG